MSAALDGGEISDGEWSELYEDNNNGNNSDSQEQAQPLIGHDAFGTTTSTNRDDEDSMDQLTQDFASQVEIGEPRMMNSNTGHQDGVQHGWHLRNCPARLADLLWSQFQFIRASNSA